MSLFNVKSTDCLWQTKYLNKTAVIPKKGLVVCKTHFKLDRNLRVYDRFKRRSNKKKKKENTLNF